MGNNLYPAIFFDTLSLFGALVFVIIRFLSKQVLTMDNWGETAGTIETDNYP